MPDCTWKEGDADDEESCPYCANAACGLCFDKDCNHDSEERHQDPKVLPPDTN